MLEKKGEFDIGVIVHYSEIQFGFQLFVLVVHQQEDALYFQSNEKQR
jgi:hypothetical protein